jgi:mono/diheme cytochrome c family protein
LALSVLAVVEAPPPSEEISGDPIAALYADNCAGCHGPTINVPRGTNLHDIIAQGSHEGMPSWGADLTNDQIDALVGFILSPAGSDLFVDNCAACHDAADLVSDDPLELKQALTDGVNYPPHEGVEIPHWEDVLNPQEITALLNFLTAPDGQRLFVTNCSSCHGRSVPFAGTEDELYQVISEGGLHLEMPAWQGKLEQSQIETLANYVVDPAQTPDGEALYEQYCTQCHFDRVPQADNVDDAVNIISTGGSHETMPVWGNILTDEQLDALATYTYQSSQGTSVGLGQELFDNNCVQCHGDFGEGGPNPARSGDIIAPISTSEYLKTRDDITLKSIISQGQPNFGMSPFGLEFGGPLDVNDIDALVSYIRSWENNPPVDLPPEVEFTTVALSGSEIYQDICAQCHGLDATGDVGPSLRDPNFRQNNSADDIFTSVSEGHPATAMIAWGDILSSEQIQDLVNFILELPESESGADSGGISFSVTILPILDSNCKLCHDPMFADGGWISTTWEDVINSGDNGPVIIPGDIESSLLAHKILGTQEEGDKMPPKRDLSEDEIQLILDWIAAGAPNN